MKAPQDFSDLSRSAPLALIPAGSRLARQPNRDDTFNVGLERLNAANASAVRWMPAPIRMVVWDPLGANSSLRQLPLLAMFQSLSVGLRQKLSDIRKLGRGWDGDDADPVRADAVCEVERLLWGLSMAKGSFQEPSIVPKYDGFLQLEWHDRSRSLEFELTPKSWLVMGTDECAGERKYFEAIAPRGSVESLIPFYRWFVREEWLWPSL